MPSYDFKNVETGLIETHVMSYKDLPKFKEDNPNLERHIGEAPAYGDGTRMSLSQVGKADSTFEKYIINRIAETVPGNTIKQSHKTKIPREW
jgi:hypothetical protein